MKDPHPGRDGYRALMIALFGLPGEPPAWRGRAACAGRSTEVFFVAAYEAEAAVVCAGCPVVGHCRADQLAWEVDGPAARRSYAAGFFGGLSGPDRQALHYPDRSAGNGRR